MHYCKDLLRTLKCFYSCSFPLPVTSATPECTFSTLKKFKICLRSKISQERLNGLAITIINKEENER